MTGVLEDRMLALTEPGGETLRDAMRRIGADPDRLKEAVRKDIVAFAELHIEQGIVLESQGLDIGIVTSFVGIRRLEISFDGEVDHAGTTPLHLRKDALVAGAETVVAVRQLAEALNAEGKGYFVATVGILNTTPMASNIVPGTCRLIVDVRSTAPELTMRFVEQIDAASAKAAETMRVRRSVFRTLSDNPPTTCDAEVQQALRDGARELGLGQIDLPSGAGHDAAYMSRICRSAMVFVPCRGGKSHAPEEWSDREQIAAGAATMLLAIKRLDQSLQTA
jgi:N-carbamoyl-L-amino-acid hydrolase